MKRIFGCLLCVMLLVVGFTPSAWTFSFDLQGVNYPSQISASVDFDYDSSTGIIDIDITNTSSITSSLTAFAFNVPEGVTGVSSFFGPTGWSDDFDENGINTPGQYGFFDLAGITGPNFNGGKVANGIPATNPDTAFSFQFALSGIGLGDLMTESFLNLLSAPGPGQSDPQFFIARFQGIPFGPGSDVAIPGNPVPEPTTMLLFGAGLVVLAGFGRKKFKK